MNAPFYYEAANSIYAEISPSRLQVENNALRQFFTRYLWQDVYAVIKWTLPEYWSEGYFKWCIYVAGVCGIINTDKFGVIPQNCTLGGYTVQYQPAYITVSNPLLRNTMNLEIGKNCEIIYPNVDYQGLADIVGYYADILSIAYESLGMNIWNSKLSYVFAGGSKGIMKSYQTMYDNISKGNPAVFVDDELMKTMTGRPAWEAFDTNVGGNFIADKLVDVINTIFDMFHTDIGIPNANTDKKERLVKDEVNANNIETGIKTESMIERMQKQVEKVRKMFHISNEELNCEWGYAQNGYGRDIINTLQSQQRTFQQNAMS